MCLYDVHTDKIVKLKAENKKLRKALEIIINEKGYLNWYEMIKVAKEALKG